MASIRISLYILGFLSSYTVSGNPVPALDRRASPTVTIDTGKVAGKTTSYDGATNGAVDEFLGIPFGAKPVRFSPPKAPESWDDVYDASKYGATCIQTFGPPGEARDRTMKWFNTPPPGGADGEDCLNLNVYAPSGASPGSKAVLFWLYGGAFTFGSGSLPLYDGVSMAANQDVVVVTINYRTNVFGFPGSSEIPTSEQNLGLLDQRLALDWVQRNIREFGGDPKQVTIVGESAGAGSVDLLLVAPPDPVPFSGAIMQSGQLTVYRTKSQRQANWKKLISATKCDSAASPLDCVRELPADQLTNVVNENELTFLPAPDGGVTFPEDGRQARQSSSPGNSKISRVPVMLGTTANEGTVFAYGSANLTEVLAGKLPPAVPSDLVKSISGLYDKLGLDKLVEGLIGPSGLIKVDVDLSPVIAALITDLAGLCPASALADDNEKAGIPTWRYYFDAEFPNNQAFPGSGAWHSSEIGEIFDTYSRDGATALQKQVSEKMQKAWADFAKDPTKGPGWDVQPEVGVYGDGARPKLSDKGRKAFKTVDDSEIDSRCALYKQIYNLSPESPL